MVFVMLGRDLFTSQFTITFVNITGVAKRSDTNQTIIIIFLQLDIVHNDRERIGNTMTTNLQIYIRINLIDFFSKYTF